METDINKKQRKFIYEDKIRLKEAKKDQIKGIDYIIEEADKIIYFCDNYEKLSEINARISPGVLMYGSPGCGKTLTARYIITKSKGRGIFVNDYPREANIWTSKDIKSLFKHAREYVEEKKEPIILFWDELEVVAKDRRKLKQQEAELVSALTTELDGIEGKPSGIIVLATTNYSENLDKALLRAGRFGNHISFPIPSKKGKKEVLQYYLGKKHHEQDFDYDSIIDLFESSTTPAEIEELVEEIYLNTCKRSVLEESEIVIKEKDIVEPLIKKKFNFLAEFNDASYAFSDMVLDEKTRYKLSIYEAGNACLGRLLDLPVQITTVMPNYNRGITISKRDKLKNKLEFKKKRMIQSFGGAVAREISGIQEDYDSWDDYTKASKIAHELIMYGSGKFKGISFGGLSDSQLTDLLYSYQGIASEWLKGKFDSEIMEITTNARLKAEKILSEFGKKKIEYVAQKILKKGFLLQKGLDKAMKEV